MVKDSFFLRKLKQIGRAFDFELINSADPADVFSVLLKYRTEQNEPPAGDIAFLQYVIRNLADSKAQLFQDLFVLYQLGCKKSGYFVEFGAANGVELSNTVLLERDYEWTGILVEPARCWHNELTRNRKCIIDTRCVWTKSGERLEFNEVRDRELSTIARFSDSDGHMVARRIGEKYWVETISLGDLLNSHNAPSCIDYLSVDTEGSEFDILQAFDFQKYDVKVITVEHNFTASRNRIYSLMLSKGFSRVFERFSRWDDWYVKRGAF